MKKKKKHRKTKIKSNLNPNFKMSELIKEYASDYINLGDNAFERQSLLNGACTAWNIAILPENLREEALKSQIDQYIKLNPEAGDADNVLHDMRLLIKKKLEMFPNVNKYIVGAFIDPVDDDRYQIRIISTYDLPEIYKMLTNHQEEMGRCV
jgi:hypothetical protein